MSRGSFYDNTNEEELIASTQTNSTNAASSATAAAASAASAAASYDAFDDRYLGTKSSDPTTDNDSNTLVDGALYFNTSNNVMMVYDLGNTTWNRTTPTSSDQTKINTVSGIQANVTTVAGISSDVTTVAGISSDVAAVENIAANVTSVAGIASNVTSVAGNATNINAVAGNATNINAATTKAAEAATSATASSNSATAAASSASTASTQAGIATAKAVLTAADAVSTAADVVSSAANAASAAATYDSFDDRYLGSKSSAPTVDNDGNALVVGALYYDSTGSVMKVYTASGWIATSSATLATMERFVFTATANQTVFTGNDAGGDTLAIVVGAEMVTLNGVVLEVTADYTVTTSTVTLNSGAAANDELNVYAFGNFEIANHYTKAAADTLYAAKASLTGAAFTGAITTNSTFDGRDVATDGAKLDNIEANATADQTAAQIKTAYESNSNTNEFSDAEQTKLANMGNNANNYVHPNHSGEVTSTADGAQVIADNVVDEANLKVSNTPTNGYFLSAQSGNTGGMTWAEVDALPSQSGNNGKYLTTNGSAASWAVLDTDANTTTKGLYEHAHTIAANYSITSGNNALTAGPITINSGISVTIPTGSTWIVA
jgi:hypothetical protein